MIAIAIIFVLVVLVILAFLIPPNWKPAKKVGMSAIVVCLMAIPLVHYA